MRRFSTITERFWFYVNKEGPLPLRHPSLGRCWIWTGAISRAGYGCFTLPQHRQAKTHRFSYEQLVGPIPDGLVIDHLCEVKACCNPAHLEPVTNAENVRRAPLPHNIQANLLKTHCPAGHPYDEANTYRYGNGRKCRRCAAEREYARRWALRA